ncbi:MAG TPA: GMC oxidoreductase [Pyrinomonadaceae bacterium]|jgi:cholesterol oxidase
MANKYDVIIIGSGFGGAVTACRLAERGQRVLILERGRRWEPKDYPREPTDPWIYDQNKPDKFNGWLDFNFLGTSKMTVVTGAGVGGGSLVYANVSAIPPREGFEKGWPPEIKYDDLLPYYKTVGDMLKVCKIPKNQLTKHYEVVRQAAERAGFSDRFDRLELAVNFDQNFDVNARPYSDEQTIYKENDFGVVQGTCVHSGNCDVGCQVRAKNTLDVNYLAVAEKKGAEIRPLHMARYLKPASNGYTVFYDAIKNGELEAGSETAERVILAAGSLGSSELLLRSRDQYKTLPNVSRYLGCNWSSNGDFLTPAIHKHRDVSMWEGPTITCGIDFLKDPYEGQRFVIEDGGGPNFLLNWLKAENARGEKVNLLVKELNKFLQGDEKEIMLWFANGIDAANGTLVLRRQWYWPWTRRLHLMWEIEKSKALFDTIFRMHKLLAQATGGEVLESVPFKYFNLLVTPHPLGGCNMGQSAADGVVNHLGEVFGYPRLYVADGAIIPEAIGINPSRTIAALAERIVKFMS